MEEIEQVKKALDKTQQQKGNTGMSRIFWILLVIGYVLSPIDVIPDAIPIVGAVDDVLVILISVISFFYNKKQND